MAILTPGKKGRRFPSFRGRVVFSARNGKIVARKWPKKRGRAKTAGDIERQERFRQANLVAKYADARQQALSRCTMNHLPVRPFDALLAAMAGRLWAVETDDQGTLYSMAARSDVSKNLDVLAQTPGDMLVRGPKFWTFISAGTPGQVLTSQGPDAIPTWEDPTGGPIPKEEIMNFSSDGGLGTNSDNFFGGSHNANAEGSVEMLAPKAMTIKNLAVAISRTPDAGGKMNVFFRLNGADTALTVQLDPGDTEKVDAVNEVAVAQGDRFCVRAKGTFMGATTFMSANVEVA